MPLSTHLASCKFVGTYSGVAGVSVLLGYGTASMGNRFLTFREQYFVSKRRDPITQWRGVIFQKKGNLTLQLKLTLILVTR